MEPIRRGALFALLPLLCPALPAAGQEVKATVSSRGGQSGNTGIPGGGSTLEAPTGPILNAPSSSILGAVPIGVTPTVRPETSVQGAGTSVGAVITAAPTNRTALPVSPSPAPDSLSSGLQEMGAGGNSGASRQSDNGASGSSHLDSAVSRIGAGQAEEAKGSDMAVGKALERIFDASHRREDGSGRSGSAGVTGSLSSSEEKVKQLVAVANSANSRDAARLYNQAIETAQKAFSAEVAGQVRAAVLGSAQGKARQSLPELANSAYQFAAAGVEKEADKDLKGLDRWEALLAAKGSPLIENAAQLKQDVRRVLLQAQKAAVAAAALGAAKTVSAPHIFFRRSAGGVYSAVLPSSSVTALPKDFIAVSALSEFPGDSLADAWSAFQRDPSARNGAGLIYDAHRRAGASSWRSAAAAASYWLKAGPGGLWQRLRAFVLSLFGRGLPVDARWGLAVNVPASLASLKASPVSWGSPGLTVARGPVAQVELRRSLGLFAVVEADRTAVRLLLERVSESQDLAPLLVKIRSLAISHQALTSDGSAAAAVESIARRAERRGELSAEEVEALAHWVRRMGSTALEATLTPSVSLPANVLLRRTGRSLALVDAGGKDSAGLRAVGLLLEESAVEGSFVVMDERIWGGWASGGRFAKIYADLRSTEQGGQVKVFFRSEDIEAAAAALSARGFSVERKGAELSASLDSESAAAGPEALADALAWAVASLQGQGDGYNVLPGEKNLVGLMADVKAHSADARKIALALQEADPVSFNYVTIGRVGPLLAQGARRRLQDGRPVVLTLLRDPDTGSAAYGRVELDGAPLRAEKVRALLLAR